MTEQHLDQLVRQVGVQRAEHTAKVLRELMPTLLKTRAGERTLAFISGLEAAAERARCPDASEGKA